MRIRGRVFKAGAWWAIEVPVLDVFTQGRTKREACEMLKDAIEELAGRDGFKVQVFAGRSETIEVSASDDAALAAFFLRRYREIHGVSLAEAAKRLGSTSKNAYARYERGTTVPTLDKMAALVRAVSPERDLVLSESEICAPRKR